MKIICTAEEKEALINSYGDVNSDKLLSCCFPGDSGFAYMCKYKYATCKECLEKNIEWIIKEKSDGKEGR